MQVRLRAGWARACSAVAALAIISPLGAPFASGAPDVVGAPSGPAISLAGPDVPGRGARSATTGEATARARSLLGFGAAVSLAGDELFVGRPGEVGFFPMPPSQPGAVHVFRRGADGGWTEVAAVRGADVTPGDGFGDALAVAGDLLVVGAPRSEEGRGAGYVFRRGGDGGWTEEARLGAPWGAPGDRFGGAVAVAGEIVVVGAPDADEGRGSLHVFRRDPASGAWSLAASLDPGGGEESSRFGATVAASGERLFVGAPGPASPPGFLDAPPAQSAGAAYVYLREGDSWRLEARLTGPGRSPTGSGGETAGFGYRILPVGEDLFVSAPTSAGFVGRVYQFRRQESGWSRRSGLLPDAVAGPAFFGASLAAAGSEVLVGAAFEAQGAGRVHVFRPGSDGAWERAQTLEVPAKGLATAFGGSLAASGDLAVVGAPAADFFEGRAFVYTRDPATGVWSETGSLIEEDGGLEAVTGDRVECEGGTAATFPCEEVDLLAFLPVERVGGERGVMLNDVWGWTDPETGREYAIVGRFDGTSFVDVTEPEDPVYVGDLPLHEGAQPNLWRDMKVYADHVFIVADGAGPHGMQVFDLARLREVEDPPATFTEDAHYDRIHSAHNIAIDPGSGFAFSVGNSMGGETCGGGLHMIDIREPTRPAFAGCHADPETGSAGTGYTHDAQCVVYRGPDEEHRGRQICFGANETALSIADVTDKRSPVTVSRASYPDVGYVHQGWLSEDQRYFFLDDELDELAGSVRRTRTLVWDVTDLDDPVLAAEHLGTTEATDHNLYVRGRYLYQSNYVSGLRILDIADPTNPVEVGWFDTVPFGSDVPGFAGSWSNYPFFESGIIVVTSMREGLFILRKREPRTIS